MEEYKNIMKVINEKLADNEFWLNYYKEENEKLKAENESLTKENGQLKEKIEELTF